MPIKRSEVSHSGKKGAGCEPTLPIRLLGPLLQVVEGREDQRETDQHYDRQGNADPQEVRELVSAGAKNQQVRLVAVRRREAHVCAEQDRQYEWLGTDAELVRNADAVWRTNCRGCIVGYDVHHQRHQQQKGTQDHWRG